MNSTDAIKSSFRELLPDEIKQVTGGFVFAAPVIVKIGAWALGAACGAGLVVGIKHALGS